MAANTKLLHSLIIFLIATSTVYNVSADSIKGCGGFVEASSSLVSSRKGADGKLDYSHITVELQTVDGLVKDSTQCAPNGYYFIPVYDKGSFTLKINGPEGWSWSPDKVPVVVDDSSCNNNEDINFRFTGFTLSGKVLGAVGGESCMIKNGGPADVNVELLSSDGDPIASVLTSSDGSYLFKNIIPGKYSIRASHPELQVEVRGSTEVELGFANGLVDDIFFVLGYDLKGSVVAQGNPILGVHIYLHSDDVSMVDCPQGLGDASGERKPLCHAVSDADGIFSFKSIPCGKYELIPHYKGENTVFDVSPPVMPVSVEHQHVTVPTKFQVTGFSIGGRVVDSNLKGVEGVKIVVDGNLRSVTDNEGYYKLDQVTSNQYTIDAVKEHYKFDKLKKFMVLPNMASLPDISAVSYDVCGVVRMFGSGHKANVALTHGPTNVKPQKKLTDESGKFCFEVPPGEYRLSAFAATPKSAPELLFLPGYMDVSVKSPLLNIEFSQARVNVHGSVTCKEKCGPSVSVALVGAAGDRDKKTVVLTNESSQFHFSDILPGKYRVEVKSISPEAISEEDTWCWDRSSIDVNVGTEDIKGIEFVQKGYWINIVSTHEVDAKIVHPSGSPTNLKIKKGLQKICVESPGAHELQLSDSCISFASNSIKIDVSNPQPIHLRAEKYLIKGLINVESSSTEIESELPESFIVDMQDEEGRVINSISAKLASVGSGVYEYYTWAKLGEKISFVPRDSRGNAEKKMLFYPKELRAVVANDGCQAAVSPFAGRPGLYIQGSVSPPLPGVNIKVSAGKDSHISSLKKGEVAVETSTSPDGSFVAGPLYDDIPYDTDASKPGYHIKRLGPYSFSCQKLGQISVRVSSKDNAETSIPPLLLSLSGDHGYRNNSISGAGGLFVFDSLFPGNFYLRPLLKEYSFKPSTLAIELGSGESSEAVFEATRVAYSAMGRVALLSGQPQEGVAIEARSDSKGYYEETTSDIDGNYRLRGLHPGATYVIKVSKRNGSGKNNIERASPESVSLQIGYEDNHGVDFLVFEQPETTILTCHVEGKQHEEINTNLLVEIKSASDVSKIENVFPLPLSNFFQVKGLSRGKHLVQLKSNRPLGSHKVVSEIIEVDFETNAQIHVGPLRYSIEADQQSQEVTPAAILPLLTGIAAIALFISIPRLKDIYQSTVGFSAPGFSASSTKREPRKAVARGFQDWTGGCMRKTKLNCSGDGFEKLRKMKLPDITKSIVDMTIGLKECKEKCNRNCNCTAFANPDMQNSCVIWVGEILDLRKSMIAGQDLFVRLAATDISVTNSNKNTRKMSAKSIMLIIGICIVFLLGVIFILFCFWKRKKRIPTRTVAPPIGNLQCVPMELVKVVKATENFSDCNKIGKGGYGIVYKGILPDGQAIAAKRLLVRSAHGIEGFTNEVNLIASVQHVNLVQLLGYCFEGEEMILLFELMENSSLDTYIFDKTKSYKIDWEKRWDITNGIARGLLYLHQDSRYRILHRDLKPSNILLDKDMVPKISDFGMAKLFARDETEATSTTNMVGTFGYMPPEYAIDRICSVKSDVFSFGVLLLEIIAGKRNNEFLYYNEESLLFYIWKLWLEGKGLDIVDPVIVDSSSTFRPSEVLRCIHIGLLCVQESKDNRPLMSSVMLMLTSDKTEMNQPERPGSFVIRNRFVIGSSSSNLPNKETCTPFDIADWTPVSAG